VNRLLALLLLVSGLPCGAASDGLNIYREHCAECHGDKGEGVDAEYDEPLIGDRSIGALAKYIDRTMPEDEEYLVV